MVGFLSGGLGADTAQVLSSFVPGAVALALGTLAGWLLSKRKLLLVGSGLVGCFTVFLILAASWSAWSHAPVRTSRDMDREVIYKAFNRVHACNQTYSKENSEKSFVASLKQLGPKGTKCLSQNEVDGMVGNRKLLYEPGPRHDGRIATYRLTTQMSFFVDKFRLETDQSGVTIYRWANGDIDEPTFGSSVDVHNLSRFWLCVITISRREGNFPSPFRAAASFDFCHNWMPRPEQTNLFHYANENTLVGVDYEFTYTPLPGKIPGQISDFRIDARPRTYGASGVRSYVVFKDRLFTVLQKTGQRNSATQQIHAGKNRCPA
jgi:hypothetical protein